MSQSQSRVRILHMSKFKPRTVEKKEMGKIIRLAGIKLIRVYDSGALL